MTIPAMSSPRIMLRQLVRWFIWAIVALCSITSGAVADLVDDVDLETANLQCEEEVRQREQEARMPPGLLLALATAESGRWSKKTKTTRPWPWTVTSGQDSFYLPSKAAAIAKVEELRANGRRNIDVGCMQINLFYHPNAFASLEEAFEPSANVAYGLKFLRSLRERTRSWGRATAHYHSGDRTRGSAYRDRVYSLWRGQERPARTREMVATRKWSPGAGQLPLVLSKRSARPLFADDLARHRALTHPSGNPGGIRLLRGAIAQR